MANLPNDPFTLIAATPTPNADLPATEFPPLPRIAVVDLVGPTAANKQHKALEKRDETLRAMLNKLVAFANACDTTFLRRDGSAQKDTVAGATADIPFGGHKATSLAAGAVSAPSTEAVNGGQLYVEQQARVAADGVLQAEIDALTPLSLSPYAVPTMQAIADGFAPDGALTSVAAGGMLFATTVSVSTPQTVLADLLIVATGDVSISAALTATNRVVEIISLGNVSITGAVTARNLRISAVGTVTLGSVTLTADRAVGGVVSLQSKTSSITSAATINASFVFAYAGTTITSTAGTWRCYHSKRPTNLDTYRWAHSLFRTPLGFGDFGQWTEVVGLAFLPDYLAPYSGVQGEPGPGGTSRGAGGGSGPAGGGSGSKAYPDYPSAGSNPPPFYGVANAWRLPAAPGGPGGGCGSVQGGEMGGVIVLRAAGGAVTLTGTTLNAGGGNGSGSGDNGGGGGGGTIKASAKGAITGGAFNASGGNGGTNGTTGRQGRPGGGGRLALIATSTIAPTSTDITRGSSSDTDGGATAGVYQAVTLSTGDFDKAAARYFLDR